MTQATEPVVVGRCPCGGYGVVYDSQGRARYGRCHDTPESLRERQASVLDAMSEHWTHLEAQEALRAGAAAIRGGPPKPRWLADKEAESIRMMQNHLGELLRILGLGDHARTESPAWVMEHEVIPAVRRLAGGAGGGE